MYSCRARRCIQDCYSHPKYICDKSCSGPNKVRRLFLSQFALEMAHPLLLRNFHSQAQTWPYCWVYRSTATVSPFLRTQNQTQPTKQNQTTHTEPTHKLLTHIRMLQHLNLKVSWRVTQTLAVKGVTATMSSAWLQAGMIWMLRHILSFYGLVITIISW